MEDKDSSNFCSNCGAPMRDSDTFCASCGTTVGKSAASTQQYGNSKPKSSRLTAIIVLSAIWAIVALAFGLYLIFARESLLAYFDSLPDFWDTMYDLYGATRDDTFNSLYFTGIVMAASGALAALTAILAAIKRFYILALIACILSSIIGLFVIVGFVGFIVAYLIYKARGNFTAGKTI